MDDTFDVAGAMIGFAIVLTIIAVLRSAVTIGSAIIDIIERIRWSLIVRFGGGLVVSSYPPYSERLAWARICRKIESEESKGFKLVEMTSYIDSNGEYVYKALLKEVSDGRGN